MMIKVTRYVCMNDYGEKIDCHLHKAFFILNIKIFIEKQILHRFVQI